MESGIYEIVNAVNGKRYVGSAVSLRHRFAEHRYGLRHGKHHSRPLQNAFRKYGEESFTFRPLLICGKGDLLFYEQRAMDVLRPEYNVNPKAASSIGKRHSAETRAKIAARAIGRKWSAEAIEKRSASIRGKKNPKLSESLKGNKRALGTKHTAERKQQISEQMTGMRRPKSPEHRAKLAAALRGRKATPEHRANQSAAQLGKKRGPYKSKGDSF